MTTFEHILIDLDENGCIIEKGSKTIYNTDGIQTINEWTKEPVKSLKTEDEVNLTSAIKVSAGNTVRSGKNFKNNLGFFHTEGSNCASNAQGVSLMSSAFSHGIGHGINTDNFSRCCTAFAARRLIKGDWINDKDEYMKPNTEHEKYAEFESDALVFCLFDSNSQQSSLRKVQYKGKAWDVKNEFFWIPSKKVAEWADAAGLDDTYAEASVSPDRYMATLLKNANLSQEAKAVLDKATEIVEKSMAFRAQFDDEKPEYQIMNFDAGWYQVKAMAKTYLPTEYDEFKKLYKKLADKMRPLVYELGFLMK